MTEYLKRATKTAAKADEDTRAVVAKMLAAIEKGGEDAARQFGRELDGYDGDILVSKDDIAKAAKQVPESLKADIQFARKQVTRFAELQRNSVSDVESEIALGVFAGQKWIPLSVAGCYVPGGRYAHVASAVMSVATAKAAGVESIVACAAPKGGGGMPPAVIYAMDLCGANSILTLGGVQGIASLAFGLFTGKPADIVVGPGNRFVVEAKRALFGKVGIDLVAGPTEILIIADDSADAEIVATDLVGQAEHGPDSPCWLISLSRGFGEKVALRIPHLINELPQPSKAAAELAWQDYGEIVVCETFEEAAVLSDNYAAEHLEIQTSQNERFAVRLKNYGALFIGEESTVAHGDKCAGPNHILPTRGAAKYTGGLAAHKFMKSLTTLKMTPSASIKISEATARLSRLEGMEAHARTADIRIKKYGEKNE